MADETVLLQGLLGESSNIITGTASFIQGNLSFLILGIILIVITVLILLFLKHVIANSIVGVIAWIIITYGLPFFGINLQLPFLPSLAVSAVFGLAGIGAMIILAFMGLI